MHRALRDRNPGALSGETVLATRLADTLTTLFTVDSSDGGCDTAAGTGDAFDRAVRAARAVDWARVDPAIFGALRQLVRTDGVGRQSGAHYTAEATIRRALDPLVFDELRTQLAASAGAPALHRLWDRLAALRLFDPACGCGNFLLVGYRELRTLERQLTDRLAALGEDPGPSRVRLAQLYGIEIDKCSARLARAALRVLGRQCGGDDSEPVIVTGCALDLDWAALLPPGEQVVIAGNPPFRGHKERTAIQGAGLRAVWRTTGVRHLDYATGWFAKALEYFGPHAGRWAFVCTNSVVQGESVPPVFRPVFAAGWRISFAHRTFAWSPDGAEHGEAGAPAAVHVVIVGFSRGTAAPRLFDYAHPGGAPVEVPVRRLNGYLVDGPDVLVEPRRTPLCPQLPAIRAGSTGIDWNHLTVAAGDRDQVRADPVAARYLRRFVGGRELINDLPRWCLWMAGPDFDPGDLHRSALLRHRVELVRAARTRAARVATRRLADAPHLFGEIRQPTGAYLAMPQTFTQARSHATAARLGAEVIASVKLFTAPDPDGLLFALFSSAMFLTWQRTVGGRLKSDPSFSASIVWNTLPLPPLAPARRAEIAAAGAAVLTARGTGPLARQYAPGRMSAALRTAHVELDELVDRAFGATGRCVGETERQRLLFARYAELTG
jgi:hypothetical protein